MRKIIVLDIKIDLTTGSGVGSFVFWLVAPQNRTPVAQPNFKSAVPTATTYAAWQATHAYALNTVVIPTAANGYAYTATAITGTGTSASTQPTWPTTPAATVIDNAGANQITWTLNAVDLNSGITASELAYLQAGLIVEVPWTSNEEASLGNLQTEVQNAYNQMQTNLTNYAFSSKLYLESWDGTTWSAPL